MVDFSLYLIFGIVGAWLINYLADVLPVHRKFVRLQCPNCQHDLDWKRYLMPIRCGNCGEAPSHRQIVVLLALPILSVMMGFYPVENLGSLGTVLWLVYFSLIIVIDLEHRLILHPVSLVGGVMGLLFGSLAHGILNTLFGGAAGFGIMLIFYYLGEVFVKFMSRRRGEPIEEVALGFGDVNLAGIIGLLLGWPGVIGGIFLAVLLGGIVSGLVLVTQLARKDYQAFQALPYGPFLAVSVFVLFYFSQFVR
jgi:leader peptidase (prepilin peptidase)/N-methyltransferase